MSWKTAARRIGIVATAFGIAIVTVSPTAAFAESSDAPVGGFPHQVALSPDGSIAYTAPAISGTDPGWLVAIDTATDAELWRVEVGIEPLGVQVSPDGGTVYVANTNSNSVSVIDTGTHAVTTWSLAGGPWGLQLDATGGTLYVSLRTASGVAVIDTATGPDAPPTVFPTAGLPAGLALDDAAGVLYVAESVGDTVRRIELDDPGAATTFAPLPGVSPYLLSLDPSGSQLWVSPWSGAQLAVVNTATTVAEAVAVGSTPRGVAFDAAGDAIVVLGADSAIVRVDSSDLSVSPPSPLGGSPEGIAAAPGGTHFWVARLLGGALALVGPPLPATPADQSVVEGETATFTATIRATFDTVRWQVQAPGGGAWSDVPGATALTLTVDSALADNGAHYRYIATSALFGSATSGAAVLEVTLAPTGVEASTPLLAAAGLLLAGVALLAFRTRRRHT